MYTMSTAKDCILELLKQKNYTGTFVEVGTWIGEFAEVLLKRTACNKLYCVDPYAYFNNFTYCDAMNFTLQFEADKYYLQTKNRLEQVAGPERVEVVRKMSMEAVNDFADGSLDFVYIDANHEYKHALEDILAWYPKVKPGGILAGDDVYSTRLEDYTNNNMLLKFDENGTSWGVFGVYPAVLEAQRQLGIQFTVYGTQFYYVKA